MEEIDFLYYKCKIYNEYIYDKVFKGLPGTENIYQKIFKDIDKYYNEKKVNYFIKLSKQIDAQILEFSTDFKAEEVEKIYRNITRKEPGNLFRPNIVRKINSIIKKGRILDNNEYHIVNEYVNDTDNYKQEEVEQLSKFLVEYLQSQSN